MSEIEHTYINAMCALHLLTIKLGIRSELFRNDLPAPDRFYSEKIVQYMIEQGKAYLTRVGIHDKDRGV